VLAAEALPEHERVLGADRDDQGEAEAEAGEGGEEVHAPQGGVSVAENPATDSSASLA
jgi:hypothetical protein